MKNLWIVGVIIAILGASKKRRSKDTISIYDITNTLPKSPNKFYNRRNLNSINQIVVHHSATTSGSPKSYANYHINKNGWPAIGYHFVIQKTGQVFQTNNLSTVSYHTSGQNNNSIGICLTGNFDIEYPTTEQIKSLKALVLTLEDKFGNLKKAAHNQFSSKSCPGHRFDINTVFT